jgi:hypothetical protein
VMRFKDFFNLQEGINWGYYGKLTAFLGGNQPDRLNYGTAKDFGGSPMLYVPIERGKGEVGTVLTAARRLLERTGVDCVPDAAAFGGWRCGPSKNPHPADFRHTGESHVTVAMGQELDPILPAEMDDRLMFFEQKGLFTGGQGMRCPVSAATGGKALVYGVARAFTDVPIVVLLRVECPRVLEVRKALGLPPPRSGYVTHVTVAYAFPHHSEDLLTTNPKFDLPQSAKARHDATYLRKQGLPEWFTPLGWLPLVLD